MAMRQPISHGVKLLVRALFIAQVVIASFSTASADESVPIIGLLPKSDNDTIGFLCGVLAVPFLLCWMFLRRSQKHPRAARLCLISSVACFVLAFALPELLKVRRYRVVSTRVLHRGDVIQEKDLKLVEFKIDRKHDGIIGYKAPGETDIASVVGKLAPHRIRADQPVDLEPLVLVRARRDLKPGHLVTIADFEETPRQIPNQIVGYQPYAAVSDVVGKTVCRPIKTGQIALEADFALVNPNTEDRKERLVQNERQLAYQTELIEKGTQPDDSASAYTYRSELYESLGKLEPALQDLEVALKRSQSTASDFNYKLRHSDLLFYLGRYEDSLHALDGVTPDSSYENRDAQQTIQLKLRSGRAKLALGQNAAAQADFDAASDLVYDFPPGELDYLRAVLSDRLGNAKAAAAYRAEMDDMRYVPGPEVTKHFALTNAKSSR